MKKAIIIVLLLMPNAKLFAQYNGGELDQLLAYSEKTQIDSLQFSSALRIFRNLEAKGELDVAARRFRTDDESSETVVRMFGKICLKSKSPRAADEYIKFMKRQKGSADEEISFCFEPLFVRWPGYILSRIADNKDLLGLLEWGFVNNHYHDLTPKNCRAIFFGLNPGIKEIYPKYKKQIDNLLATTLMQLKS